MPQVVLPEVLFNELRQSGKAQSYLLEHHIFLNELLDLDEEFKTDISIENCTFRNDFVAHMGIYHGAIAFRNCRFEGNFVFHATTCLGLVLIENGCFLKSTDMDCGTFYGSLMIKNTVFEGFVNFQDQDLKGATIILNNQFNGGTNLLHPKGGPNGALFAQTPQIEGNTGLDKFEKGQSQGDSM